MNETAKRREGETTRKPIWHFRDLEVYQNARAAALRVYELSKKFPTEATSPFRRFAHSPFRQF